MATQTVHHDPDLVEVTMRVPRSSLPAVVQHAIYISRENCKETFGFDPKTYQKRIVPALRAAGVRVHRVGHLSLVAADDLAAWLATRQDSPTPVPPPKASDDDESFGLEAVTQ